MPQTTIILGAGASADFGLPLGNGLFAEIQDRIAGFRDDYRSSNERYHFFDASQVRNWAYGDELKTLLCEVCADEGGIKFSPLFQLVDKMDQAPAYTIDTFALENPEHTEICRILTATTIIDHVKRQISGEPHDPQTWKFCSRNITQHPAREPRPNWMTLFVSAMRSTLRKNADHKFRFVSFNYDKLAENGMRRIWNTASVSLGKFDDIVQFTYPHGCIDWAVNNNGHSQFSIRHSKIVFAHIKASRDSFELAQGWLLDADTVFSLGFHFSPENVASLGMDKDSFVSELIYQNYDGNPGLDRRIAELPLVNKPVSFKGPIADAILQGQLGNLPT